MADTDSAPVFELAVPLTEDNLVVEVLTRRLTPGQTLILRNEIGEIAGSVVHFGLGTNAPGVLSQLIVIDRSLVLDGKLRLSGWIETETGARPATDTEFLGLRLAQ
ncbi:MAG: hypothetical protein QNJ09_05940 [Paracoccaceae bacterium]|nr:hypothetical protein [Paracoccaceae bacterium]